MQRLQKEARSKEINYKKDIVKMTTKKYNMHILESMLKSLHEAKKDEKDPTQAIIDQMMDKENFVTEDDLVKAITDERKMKRKDCDIWKGNGKWGKSSKERKRLGVDDTSGFSPSEYLKSIGLVN